MNIFYINLRKRLSIKYATRIEDACEVEIEEFYDISGKGGARFQANAENINFDMKVEEQKNNSRVLIEKKPMLAF